MLIKRAYEFASKKHKGQKRKASGKPYIIHPIEVAKLLSEFDDEVVCAGLLHDVLEDCNCTIDEMRGVVGNRITNLVIGMTKDKNDIFMPLTNLARNDKRVILIKLADRYHNMNDGLYDMKLSTQKRYLQETPKILKIANSYDIDFLVKRINENVNDLKLRLSN